MRKTLIDKCEEVINGRAWPGAVSTQRIFKDLLQFYGTTDASQFTMPTEGTSGNQTFQ